MERFRKDPGEIFSRETLERHWPLLLAAGITLMALWIRTLPLENMEQLQALDTYVNYRISQHVALEGVYPYYDFLRYFPYNTPTYITHLGVTLVPAVFFWMGPFLLFDSYLGFAQFFPALMGALTVFFAYLLGNEMWDKYAGVSAAFFMATIAGIMHRSSAGFFEKEPIGGLMLMVSLYCFVRGWKRKEWLPGIFSGLALGVFTISWGGSQFLWLLYPLTVLAVMLIDEDIDRLVRVYTPTVIIGGVMAASLNPGRFWILDNTFLLNFAMLGFLWSRYAVEEFNVLEDKHLKFYTPGMSLAGIAVLALSPLYSQFIASKFMSLLNRALSGSSGVIGGTVAENTPMTVGELTSQLGAGSALYLHESVGFIPQEFSAALGMIGNLVGAWPLSFIGMAVLANALILMILRKYSLIGDEIGGENFYYMMFGTFVGWVLLFSFFFQSSVFVAVLPSILGVVGGLLLIYTFEEVNDQEIEFKWYYFIPVFWYLSTVLRASQRSRVIFLAAFPVAMMAGYMFGLTWKKILEIDYSLVTERFEGINLAYGVLAAVIIIVFSVNLASGYLTASNLQDSPSDAWNTSLNYMEEDMENDAVVMSWWDYGYWFQTIGERATVADGGNFGYFAGNSSKMPYHLADFFTDSNDTAHRDLFEKHSVDYIVLDNSMIGKYQAVSQIANRDNENFEVLQQVETPGTFRNSLIEDGDRFILEMNGRRFKMFVPINITGQGSVEIIDRPTIQTGRGQRKINCVIDDSGRTDFVENQTSQYCLAKDPFASFERGLIGETMSRAVLVPESEADSALVRLYLMNGHGMDWVEPVEDASNGYVRMWEVVDKP